MTPKKRKKDVEAAEAGVEEQDASVAEEVDEDPLTRAERERDEAIANWQRARADYKNLNRRSLESIEAANVTLRRIVRVAKWICVALDDAFGPGCPRLTI